MSAVIVPPCCTQRSAAPLRFADKSFRGSCLIVWAAVEVHAGGMLQME
jgi:hypothetical protein